MQMVGVRGLELVAWYVFSFALSLLGKYYENSTTMMRLGHSEDMDAHLGAWEVISCR